MEHLASGAERVIGIHPRALDLSVPTGRALVPATLNVPIGARGVVAVFAPPGRSRYDAPSKFFAQVLEQAGLATLSLDPIDLAQGDEVDAVVYWLRSESFTRELSIGLLGFDSAWTPRVPEGVAALVVGQLTPRSAELASEYFVARLIAHREPLV